MSEVLVDFITTLDGHGAAEGAVWWGSEYTVLMGATTYRVMSGYAAECEPADTQLVARDAAKAVWEMKKNGSKSMRTMGGLSPCRSLLDACLVDRVRVVVFPVIAGSSGGERIYDDYPDVALDMIRSRTFDGRTQLPAYAPTVLSGPPNVDTGAEQ